MATVEFPPCTKVLTLEPSYLSPPLSFDQRAQFFMCPLPRELLSALTKPCCLHLVSSCPSWGCAAPALRGVPPPLPGPFLLPTFLYPGGAKGEEPLLGSCAWLSCAQLRVATASK